MIFYDFIPYNLEILVRNSYVWQQQTKKLVLSMLLYLGIYIHAYNKYAYVFT